MDPGELGTVVFLHGFPKIWYSWRHQMLAAAATGYRAVALDCRGYGLSDQPSPENEASKEPGRAEADFGRHDIQRVVRTIYVLFSGADVPIAKGFAQDATPAKRQVPDLKTAFIPEGSHFVQEQLPEQVNELLLGFLKDHAVAANMYESMK
ncbi:unnamed protein product [Urochloa decumbens]|uniref:AB hydrolase-1 domain-containing protein n=1 Tax=Urochloa decumbens TaxID=240449 RepID=A0ABC8VYY7_9POAL